MPDPESKTKKPSDDGTPTAEEKGFADEGNAKVVPLPDWTVSRDDNLGETAVSAPHTTVSTERTFDGTFHSPELGGRTWSGKLDTTVVGLDAEIDVPDGSRGETRRDSKLVTEFHQARVAYSQHSPIETLVNTIATVAGVGRLGTGGVNAVLEEILTHLKPHLSQRKIFFGPMTI